MAIRNLTFVEGEYYHVFNRGLDKRAIFHDKEDLDYFLHRMKDFNSSIAVGGHRMQQYDKYQQLLSPASKLVEVVSYCLLPNHFHLILKQSYQNGITNFMQRIGTGYVKYFNKKYGRSGALFQGRFKATKIETSLEFVSVYVNLNNKHHHIDAQKNLVASSYDEFLGHTESNICTQNEISAIVDSVGDYEEYALMQSDYFTQRKDALKNEFE